MGNSNGNKSAEAIAARQARVARWYKVGLSPAAIAEQVGISAATVNAYIKALADRGEITLRAKPPRIQDDPVRQLLAQAKKRGTSESERERLVEEAAALLQERDEARNATIEAWAKAGGRPSTRAWIELVIDELEAHVRAKRDEQQKPATV